MDELIQLLKQFEMNVPLTANKYDFISNLDIEALASHLLINECGECNWMNIDVLEENGFSVIPIEKDSVGWLIGGIVTTKGIITYG